MKNAFKKIGKYLLILLLLLLGLAAMAMIFLFFVPSADIFGICYISADKTYYSKAYDITQNNISLVSMQNSSYPVRVINSEDNNISVAVYENTFGYVLKKNSQVKINSRIVDALDGEQLVISVAEPHGFAYKSNSYIALKLPKTASLSLSLSNKNAGAKIELADTNINNFSYSANSGDVYLNSGKIANSLNLKLARTNFVINKNFDVNAANVLLNLTSGKFTSNAAMLNTLTLQNLTTGVVSVNACNNLAGNLEESGGRLNITTLSNSVNLNSTDTKISITNLNGTGGRITLTKSGAVSIGNLTGGLVAITNSGNINISKTESVVHLKTQSGNISIDSAALNKASYSNFVWDESETDIKQVDSPIWLENEEGKTNLTFAEGEDVHRSAYLDVGDGATQISGAERVKLFSSGQANATINYLKVVGKSYLQAKGAGNLTIYTPTNANVQPDKLNKYTLTTSSELGSVSILISQTIYLENSLGDTNKELHNTWVGTQEEQPQGEEWQNNVIDAHTYSGALTIRNW